MEKNKDQFLILALKSLQFLTVNILLAILAMVTKNIYIILITIFVIALLSFVKMNYID